VPDDLHPQRNQDQVQHQQNTPLGADDVNHEKDADNQPEHWIVKAGLLGASTSSNFIRSICTAVDDDETPQLSRAAQSVIFNDAVNEPLYEKPVRNTIMHTADHVLPSRRVADHLVDMHWKCSHVPWIDRLRFMNWYEGLWTGRDDQNVRSRL
jgi:hypothetical protein